MIKFIASDLDGTLLLNGAQEVDRSFFDVIDKISYKKCIFAPASGRQMVSLQRLFAPVADELLYIAENGALVKYKDETIAKTPIDRKLAMDIIEDVINMPNCEVLVSGEKTAYIKPKSDEYRYRMTKVINYHTTLVDDFSQIDEDILKVAVCDLSGIVNSKDYFMSKWKDLSAVTVSGDLYIDFMDKSVNKGMAVKQVQQYFGITKDECMAFGDNFNDIEMLDEVTYSYAMEKAVSEVKAHANYITANVEKILRQYF
ncbi:MAG: HAD family hydrolase [Lachnospira sp.]